MYEIPRFDWWPCASYALSSTETRCVVAVPEKTSVFSWVWLLWTATLWNYNELKQMLTVRCSSTLGPAVKYFSVPSLNEEYSPQFYYRSFADVWRYYSIVFTGPVLIYWMSQTSLKFAFCGFFRLMMQYSSCSSVCAYKTLLESDFFFSSKTVVVCNQNLEKR